MAAAGVLDGLVLVQVAPPKEKHFLRSGLLNKGLWARTLGSAELPNLHLST